ncbi:MAG: RluA family pseudouridine synthase [Alicyclobacillaceae bacterium]|nr:RluA family pseudouridine synthase [Alicyclobacillaceae bacterium]
MTKPPGDEQKLSWTVDAGDAGRLVREILQGRLGVSRRLIRLSVSQGGIRKNGVPAFLTERVQPGDVLEVRWRELPSEDVIPEPIPFETVYEDDDVLVVNKPPGMLVHPTKGEYTGTLANGVVYAWRNQGIDRPFRPLHRLDRDTSGLVLIAKNQFAHKILSDDIQGRGERHSRGTGNPRAVRREYQAIVEGVVRADRGWIDLPIGRDPEHPNRRRIDSSGKPARTFFEVRERTERATLLRVCLETGRTHQIRVHLAEIGHPVVGDTLYGRASPHIHRHALHAGRLVFRHPTRGEWIDVTAPWFSDMCELWAVLSGRGDAGKEQDRPVAQNGL